MKRFNIKLLAILLFSTFLNAEEYSFVNIFSNEKNTTINIDGVEIGKAPIYSYKVFPDSYINIEAKGDERFYPKSTEKSLFIKKDSHPTINMELKKGNGKIVFKGQDAHLYINNKFITTLEKHNRTIEHEADENLKIEIFTNEKRYTGSLDLYADQVIELSYVLKKVNLEQNLYTLPLEKIMWQDDTDAKSKTLNFEDAQRYCKELELAKYTDWRIPSVEELKGLYEIKDKLYNGVGVKSYWSSKEDNTTSHIWKYAQTINFETGKEERKVQSFYEGNIRCVRSVD